jgi:molybdate/tungstate transport system substrate-binding protein
MRFILSGLLTILALGAGAAGAASAYGEAVSGEVAIFHAGSLSVPMQQIADAFTRENPGVKILREAAGSRDCARKITELQRPCDVLAVSDYAVIDTLLIPKFADWNIRFAGNEMALVYGEKSRRAKELTAQNWFEILLDKDVAFGRADANADPCGYRTVLAMKLAEKYYGKQGLAEKVLAKDTRYIRPKETDLLALLETGSIDYIFLYRSVAEQHGLKWLALPDEVNLKKTGLADLYKSVSVELTGAAPGTTITQRGEPMVYGVTIPANAPNAKAALAFVDFLLSKDKGMAVMEKNGQPSVVPAPATQYEKLPAQLKQYAKP